MYRLKRGLRFVTLSILVPVWAVVDPSPALGTPARLRVRVDPRLLGVSERARVTVEFLDREYHVVPNDRARRITLRTYAAGPRPAGSGEIVPATAAVPQGVSSASAFRFTARSVGRLTIEATSDGLAAGKELVNIVPRHASLLSRLLFPPVYARSPLSLRIYPQEVMRVPVNGISSAQLWVTLDPVDPSHPRARHARVTTSPVVPIVYGGQETLGFANVEIDGELGQSEQIEIRGSDPGPVKVSAVLVSSGETDMVEVQFVPPRPRRILLDPDQVTVPSDRALLPLTVRLADQEGLRIETLDRAHEIRLGSASQRQVSFEPQAVTVSPDRPSANTDLDLRSIPTGAELLLLARDAENDLAPGSANVKVALAPYVLFFLASLGGLLGGLARHVYRVGTPALWPKRVRGRLDPGVAGNVLFGSVFGLVLFQAAQLGLLHATGLGGARASCSLAFFLGVVGGVGGILLVERLIGMFLPAPRRALTPMKG